METQAYFTNIRAHISAELTGATSSIYVAVAWFTDSKIFEILCDKAKAGLDVQLILMDDYTNRTYGLDYTQLEACGGRVHMINDKTAGITMHNKFCVIDGSTTITGSYNWSKRAQSNHENITINRENEQLAQVFTDEFKRIKVLYHGHDTLKQFDVEIICRRLTMINSLIQLEEHDQITLHTRKIAEYELRKEIISILDLLNRLDFKNASERIQDYLVRIQSITLYDEVDLDSLKWEIKYLEIEIVTLENEKGTLEKYISDFVHKYNTAFGSLILEILKLKKEKLKNIGRNIRSEEYEKAEERFNNFKSEYAEIIQEQRAELSNEDQEELKKAYRKAVVLCHPDKFTEEEMKRKAHRIFVELSNAYKKNELSRVLEILHKLENGIYDIDEKDKRSTKKQLQERLDYLKQRRSKLFNDIIIIKNDKSYRDIKAYQSNTAFFEEEQERLENELNSLKNEQY
ncbi:hypothetical protein FHS57_001651 [Runella defluvii]|uniref:phospholipase D n=1 Tax=Runella defluvii TaxID=370973 RepID=A0A7W5ZIU3_9BACT|nr:phospholipase D-like domain-containing protein [Runella defluvii]MBB3837654.1 hypothetical protein [Runella defluvii]